LKQLSKVAAAARHAWFAPAREGSAESQKHELLMVVLERFYPRWYYRGFRGHVMALRYYNAKG